MVKATEAKEVVADITSDTPTEEVNEVTKEIDEVTQMVEMTGAIIVAEEATIEIADVLENTKLTTNDKNKGTNEDTKNSKVTEDSVDISDAVEEAEEKAKSIEEVKVEAVEANIVSTKEEEITVAKEAISEEDIAEVTIISTVKEEKEVSKEVDTTRKS